MISFVSIQQEKQEVAEFFRKTATKSKFTINLSINKENTRQLTLTWMEIK